MTGAFTDPASLLGRHRPDIGADYFAACRAKLVTISDRLEDATGRQFEIFLAPNASVAFAAIAGHVDLCVEDGGHYPQFMPLLTYHQNNREALFQFRTHLSPITGRRTPLRETSGFLVVDAAQTFFTSLEPELLERADIWFSPLHKNMDAPPGLAVVAIRKSRLRLEAFRKIQQCLKIIEGGSWNRGALSEIASRLHHQKRNSFRFSISRSDVEELRERGFEFLSDIDDLHHIASFRVSRALFDRIRDDRAMGKKFNNEAVLRYSYHSSLPTLKRSLKEVVLDGVKS